jgi:hypothetical protein
MAPKTVGGICGVLGGLISSVSMPGASSEIEQPQPIGRKAGLYGTPNPLTAPPRRYARLGRPPDSGRQATVPKQKVTLRLPSGLIDEYRDWSWEAKCQLSELVGQALISYLRSYRAPQ